MNKYKNLAEKLVPLSEFLENHSQRFTAKAVGVTPGAIWQMVENKRKIFISRLENGNYFAYELKPIGRSIPDAAAAHHAAFAAYYAEQAGASKEEILQLGENIREQV